MINEHQVQEVQAAWGDAIVTIGAAPTWEAAHTLALQAVQDLYQIDEGTLLFCPTKASDEQFRATLQDAVSYFVGRDPTHSEDKGFALEPWTSVRFENAGIVCRADVAMAMGNYFFGRTDGSELRVEYSFAYVRDDAGSIRIQMHHSALPYSR
jgi:hypothetical protein